jgi:Tfp pilus assembly protein PilZ
MDHGDRGGAGPGAPPGAAVDKIRIPFIRRARLVAPAGAEDVFVIDIGMKGAFVERQEPLPVDTPVDLCFHLPGNERELVARCRVAWWHPAGGRLASRALPPGVGLAFLEFRDDGAERVRRHVLDYLGRNPRSRRFNRRPEAAREDGR